MQALVFDLDETLLNSSKEIGDHTYASLLRWLKNGKDIILATSRPIRSVRKFIPEKFLAQVTSITLNGCVVYEADGSFFRSVEPVAITESIVKTMLHNTSKQPIHMTLELHGEKFAVNRVLTDEELWDIHAADSRMLIDIDHVNYSDVVKIAVDGSGRNLSKELSWLNSIQEINAIAALNNTFINVVPASADKSHALISLLQKRNIALEDVAVFGDDIPDLGMMQIAGLSIAMSNADKSVKEIADTIIGHHDDDIIGTFIEETL